MGTQALPYIISMAHTMGDNDNYVYPLELKPHMPNLTKHSRTIARVALHL
jgi:hypothetical protein